MTAQLMRLLRTALRTKAGAAWFVVVVAVVVAIIAVVRSL
jgi:hypothetical protein